MPDGPWTAYQQQGPWTAYGQPQAPQQTAESLWQRLMGGIGAPAPQQYQGAGPAANIWQHLLSAGTQAIEQGLPTALMAMGGEGPASSLGRMALSAGTGALGAAAAPGTPQERLGRAETGAAIGGGLGAIGETVGHLITPKLGPDAATLAAKGVTLTPGVMGGRYSLGRDLEERAASLPKLRMFIADKKARTIDSFNRATINQALEPIGQSITTKGPAGHDVVKMMANKVSQFYDKTLGQAPRLNVDQPLLNGMAAIEMNARGRPDVWRVLQGEWNHAFGNVKRLGGAIGPKGGNLRIPPMTGEQAQKAMSLLGSKARLLGRSQNFFDREAGSLLGQAREQVLDAFERQYPALAPDLDKANQAWSMVVRIEDAAGRRAGAEGRFTPMDLLQATRSNATGVRRRQFVQGDAVLQTWAETAQRALAGTLGESGTTPRAYALNPLAWGVGMAGKPVYAGLAAASRSQPGVLARAAGVAARRLPSNLAPAAASTTTRDEPRTSVTGP